MSRGFLAQKQELAQRQVVQQCRADMVGGRTQGMYLPQRKEGNVNLNKVDDLTLKRGLCPKSGGNLSVCRACGAPCSFGRILMERQDARKSEAERLEAERIRKEEEAARKRRESALKASLAAAEARKKRAQETTKTVKQATDAEYPSNVDQDRRRKGGETPEERREHARKASMAAAEARKRRAEERASQPKTPQEAREEYLRRRQAEYARKYYQKNKARMVAYNREYKRMCAQRKYEQKMQASEAEREAKAQRTDLSIKDTFAARLGLTLYNAGMTSAEMARELGVQEATVRSWATGTRTPTLDKLAKVCKLLNVSADWMMGLRDTP